MAYSCILAAVQQKQVDDFRNGLLDLIQPLMSIECSHLIAYWVQPQPLGGLLGEAISGGDLLGQGLWHPLKSPTVHMVKDVQRLHSLLAGAWMRVVAEHGKPEADDWYGIEISKVLDVFCYSASQGLALVVALRPPFDEQIAKRVKIPIAGFP